MVGAVVAAIMAASFFVPWFVFFGNEVGPTMLFGDNGPPLGDLPWQGFAFLASFAVAALAAVVALMRGKAGILMLAAGVIPFALIAQQVMGARDQMQDYGLPIPEGGNPAEAFDMVRDFVAMGVPMYFISAALLVVIGLLRMLRGA
ncbi:hypothetical protein L0664_13855 [Octadecabacter sp. G9-8]|uniref:Uncharacterized protein n=1 Tax=Octadecabacter dasysiphoniae TaxID=2909341 RepID=A0ABS9CZ29_9RHOB|nr:hypothetical protein [Octadecabacter dasysiphoniae]MCF2872156.1 hypothetical protein [Octadecabacter dasysiphoniae]